MEIGIRECTLNDVNGFKALFDLNEIFHREHLPSRFRKPHLDYPEVFLKQTLEDINAKIFLAIYESEVVGYVYILIKDLPNHPIVQPGKIISVEQLTVSPSVRRMKVGSRLMNAAEHFAKSKGFLNLQLNVWKFNETAEKFYEKVGYKAASIVMTKKITD